MDHETTDIGSRLQQARERRGLTLRDIANATKISMTALTAIEHNDFARLPGGVFTRAYVRAFADEVGLDADELIREYRSRFEPEIPADPLLIHGADRDDRSRRLRGVAAVSATVAGILIGALLISKATQIPGEPPAEEWPRSAVEGDLLAQTTAIDALDSLEEVSVADAAVDAAGEPSLRLDIRLNGLCWVSAVADGERVLYRLMQPGERAVIEARSAITLRVGDAGTVAYSINGAAGRPLGQAGEVVTVRITSENLESLQAEPGVG